MSREEVSEQSLEQKRDDKARVYVGNLPYGATEEEVQAEFERFGAVSEVRMPRDRSSNKNKGFCFVQFEDEDVCGSVCQTEVVLQDRRLKVDPASNGGSKESNKTLFVGNIPFGVSSEKITEVFSLYGTVTQVRMPKEADGRQKGFCYVQFESEESSEAALNAGRDGEGIVIEERRLRLDKSGSSRRSFGRRNDGGQRGGFRRTQGSRY